MAWSTLIPLVATILSITTVVLVVSASLIGHRKVVTDITNTFNARLKKTEQIIEREIAPDK